MNNTFITGNTDPYLIAALFLLFFLFLFFCVRVLTVNREAGIWSKLRPSTARSSPHYIQGFHYLISGQRDASIGEFTKVAHCDTEAPEVYLVLGNLYREKGLLDKAIRIHKALLKRKNLLAEEEILALFSLAADFEQAGFLDRAARLFERVLERDPGHTNALEYIANLYERLNEWELAFNSWEKLLAIDKNRDKKHVAFLRSKIGENLLREGSLDKAQREFIKAIKLFPQTPPAYICLGETYFKQGRIDEAVKVWEDFIEANPEYAYIVIDRLDNAYKEQGRDKKIYTICNNVIKLNPNDWRLRSFLAGKLIDQSKTEEGMQMLLDAASLNPSNMLTHIKYLEACLSGKVNKKNIKDYLETVKIENLPETLFECLSCHYRTDELLWHCPHCQEWDTFVEV